VFFFNAVLSSATAIYFFKTNESSAHFDSQHISQTVWYDQGKYDIETWTCELRVYAGGPHLLDDFSRQCKIENVGRLMLLMLCFVAIVTALLGLWAVGKDMHPVRRREASWKNEEEYFELVVAKEDNI
jgi:hypothetical protein